MKWEKSLAFFLLSLCIASTLSSRGEQQIPFHPARDPAPEAIHVQPLNLITPFSPWRDRASGGVNVLYCYLRVNGVALDYSNLRKQQAEEIRTKDETVLTLAHLAAKNGLPLRPSSLTMDELNSCAKPLIVHMDGETPEAGAFLLVLNIIGENIYFFNGPSATIHEVSRENFRRVWSGIALLPVPNRKTNTIFGAIGLSAGLILPLVIRFTRNKKPS